MKKIYLTTDRQVKYCFGCIRLALVFSYIGWKCSVPQLMRWIPYATIGALGGLFNVELFSAKIAIVILACICLPMIAHELSMDSSIAIYLAKTLIADFFASKLDNRIHFFTGIFSFGLLSSSIYMRGFSDHARIFPLLFIVQFICEYGDRHWEQMIFFRHRFSFELFTLFVVLWIYPDMKPSELLVIQLDLIACVAYRAANSFAIIYHSPFFTANLLFNIFGLVKGIRIVLVTDPEIAVAVMQSSSDKGLLLEREIALPAWLPVISLESVDGEIYSEMRAEFNVIMKVLPPLDQFRKIVQKNLLRLEKREGIIDANRIAQLSLAVFLEYVFDREWEPQFQALVDSSWEWRKEIAVKGKGDMKAKMAAIDVLTSDLLPKCPLLWNLFGEKWREPRYYSLILQPFFISPVINSGDIMVAFKRYPDLEMEAAVRKMHPFPVFERYTDKDVIFNGRLVVQAHSQVIMFTNDWVNSAYDWPIFGAGKRICAGSNIARIWLKEARKCFQLMGSRFQPEKGHLYSGRNNDTLHSFAELQYYISIALKVIFSKNSNQ
jgi:hypothetical protein